MWLIRLIKRFKNRQITKRKKEICQQANDFITITDFGDQLFIAYQNIPLVPIQKSWTSEEILQQLSITRNNYINAEYIRNGLNNN